MLSQDNLEVSLRPIKFVAVLGNTIIALLSHLRVTVSNITFQKLKAILDTQFRSDCIQLLFLTFLIGVVSKHLTVSEGHGLKGVHQVFLSTWPIYMKKDPRKGGPGQFSDCHLFICRVGTGIPPSVGT